MLCATLLACSGSDSSRSTDGGSDVHVSADTLGASETGSETDSGSAQDIKSPRTSDAELLADLPLDGNRAADTPAANEVASDSRSPGEDGPPQTEDVSKQTPDVAVAQPEYPPDKWGPYAVGVHEEQVRTEEGQTLTVMVWYPAIKAREDKWKYLFIIEGEGLKEPAPAVEKGPYPLVLFSHGFNGINFQSFAITEYMASHGFVVAAPNHAGNTFFDANASTEEVAQVAVDRPGHMAQTHKIVMSWSNDPTHSLAGLVNSSKIAIAGHSFGGWTALLVAGGVVNVDYGKQQCDAGTEADVFCPYINHWPAGATIASDPPIPGITVALYYAPGGVAGFDDKGLQSINVPSLIMGGTLDKMIPLQTEVNPIYAKLPPPKTRAVIEGASHMSFTNICDVPGAVAFLADLCSVEGVIESAQAHHISRTLSVAWLRMHIHLDSAMSLWLSADWIATNMPAVKVDSE